MRRPALRWPPALDLLLAAIGLAASEVAVWLPDVIGTTIAGPLWLRLAYPFLLGVPLAFRRTAPLAAYGVIIGGVALQAAVTWSTPEGLELMFTVGCGTYAVAAYSARGRALAGLVIGVAGYAVYAAGNADARGGRSSDLWATSFFGIALVAVWLVGMFVRHRREEQRLSTRAAEIERQARTAVADERVRLARELHDVVSHNLSVVVLQAAGARAAGEMDGAVLEKIERSGRESLVEMRRLLGVLRRDDDGTRWEPQPGVAGIADLVERVRAAGVPVDLAVDDACRDLPAALDASVYRIVQEALTNVIKHAAGARASVRLTADARTVTVEVTDDGQAEVSDGGGHGLVGMRERVALFGGRLTAGPVPGGGFAVRACLVRDGAPAQ